MPGIRLFVIPILALMAGCAQKPAPSSPSKEILVGAPATAPCADCGITARAFLAKRCLYVNVSSKNRRYTRTVVGPDGGLTVTRDSYDEADAKRLFPEIVAFIKAHGGNPAAPALICVP